MKQFENKVLFIKDEPMLEEVRGIIIKSSFGINKEKFCLLGSSVDYLYLDNKGEFGLSFEMESDQEITLEQFKELLKQK